MPDPIYPLLSIRNLTIRFRNGINFSPGVEDIGIQVQRGEMLALVGESGSGKSITALSVLQLLNSPPAEYMVGEILFCENGQEQVNLLAQDKKMIQKIRGNKISMIFQEPMTSLNPVFTCGEQVDEAIKAHQQLVKTERKQLVLDLFQKVSLPQPADMYSRYPHQLSGGQKQRVMIALAICNRPALLICDEPTTALDVTVQKTILSLIRSLQQELNIGVIFITHDLGIVAEIADRVAVMHKGRIVEQADVQELFLHPQHPYTKALLQCRPILYHPGERLPVISDFLVDQSPVAENKRKAEYRFDEQGTPIPNQPLKAVMEVKNLEVWFPAPKKIFGRGHSVFKAVDNVSFSVYENETLGLVGESGCGKTTLGRALLGLIKPQSGSIVFSGRNIAEIHASELKKIRKDIQIVFQDPYSSLNPRITVGDAILEAITVHAPALSKKMRSEKVGELLEKVNLSPSFMHRYPHEFSGGQRQRMVIARALILNPSFLVLDESVSALDVSVQAQVLNLLNDLKQEFQFTVIFISHDLGVVRYMSDRILVMQAGKIVESGPAEEIYTGPKQEYTRKLISSIPGRKNEWNSTVE